MICEEKKEKYKLVMSLPVQLASGAPQRNAHLLKKQIKGSVCQSFKIVC